MNRYSGRSRTSARALIASAALWVLSPWNGTLAQESAVPAANASSEVAAEAAAEPRSARERRRAARAQAGAPPAESTATAPSAEAAPAVAQADAAAADPGSESTEPQRICKSVKPLGTRMAKRVCGTPEQWAAIEGRTSAEAGESMRQVHEQSGILATQPGPAVGPP